MRPERGPPHGGDEFMHPAMRERNRMLHEGEASRQPRRTIEKELKVRNRKLNKLLRIRS